MKQIKTILYLIGLSTLLFAYNNCSQSVKFRSLNSETPSYNALADSEDVFDLPPADDDGGGSGGGDLGDGGTVSDDNDDDYSAPPGGGNSSHGDDPVADEGDSGSDHAENPPNESHDNNGNDDDAPNPRKDRVCEVRQELAAHGNKVSREEECSAASNDSNKCAVICHVPPGNPAAAHTIIVGLSAVEAHLRNHQRDGHGDYLGPCVSNLPPQEDNCEDEGSSEE